MWSQVRYGSLCWISFSLLWNSWGTLLRVPFPHPTLQVCRNSDLTNRIIILEVKMMFFLYAEGSERLKAFQRNSRDLTLSRLRWNVSAPSPLNQIRPSLTHPPINSLLPLCKYPNIQPNPSFPVASARLLIGVAWRHLHLWHSPPVNVRHNRSRDKLVSAHWDASDEVNRQE